MHKILKELDSHFIVELPSGVTIKVAKNGLTDKVKDKVLFLAEGGIVPDKGFIPIPEGPSPAVVPVNVNAGPPVARFTGARKATKEELDEPAMFAPSTPDVYKTAIDQVRPIKQAPIQPKVEEYAPGGAEESIISPLDFPVEAASLASAGAKGLVRGALAGRQAVYKAVPSLASEVGAVGGQKVAPRINPLGMYSKLEQTLEEKMGGSASPEQIKGMLRDVKPEEMQYSGLNQFLVGKDKISKQELLDFVKANELPVQEKIIGKITNKLPEGYQAVEYKPGKWKVTDGEGRIEYASGKTKEDAIGQFNLRTPEGKTKFEGYTLPGGENYREKLYTLPEKEIPLKNRGNGVFSYGDYTIYKNEKNGAFDIHDKNGNIVDSATTLDNAKKSADFGMKKESYKSSHWDEPNVLAHTRLNDRIDDEGRKHLFVEEIQSDWHQAGRKKGYKGGISGKIKNDPIKESPDNPWIAISEDGNIVQRTKTEEEALKALKSYEYNFTNRVPDAPMKKTWHEFVSKNLLNDAAKGGYDNVSWTTGAQQAERYDLSKSVDNVLVKKNGDGTFAIKAQKNGDTLSQNPSVKDSELEDLLGKDLSEKVRSFKGQSETFAGNDLKVGGEGMKGFYDKMIPDYMAKIGKKYGVKPEKIDIPTDKFSINSAKNDRNAFIRWAQLEKNKDIQALEDIGDEKTLNKLRKQYQESLKDYKKNTQQVWTMKITPEMRKEILEKGLPLYSVGGAVAGGMLGNNEAEAKPMNYKMLENKKDFYVMQHPDGSTFKVAKKGLKPEVMKKIEGYADFIQKAKGTTKEEYMSFDQPEQTASYMPEQPAEPDFAKMALENPRTPQDDINQQIGQATKDIEGKLFSQYAKAGIPQDYTPERIRGMAEEKVLGERERQALAQKNAQFVADQDQQRRAAETLAYNERAARVGMPLRPVPGQKQELPMEMTGVKGQQDMMPDVPPKAPTQEVADPFKMYEEGLMGEARAKQRGAEQQAATYQQLQTDLNAGNKEHNKKLEELYSKQTAFEKAAADSKVNPDRYWQNASVPGKISASIGLILGGIGSGLTGTENAALKIINQTIDNDIEAQKKNIDQANNLYRMNLDAIKNEKEAYNVTKAQMIGVAELKLKEQMARTSSQEAIAQGKIALGKLQLAKQQLLQQTALDQVVTVGQDNPKMITPEILEKLPAEQRERFIPGYGFTISKPGAEKIRSELLPQKDTSVQMIDDLINLREKYGRELTNREVVAEANTIRGFLRGQMRTFLVGPGAVTENEQKILDQIISDPTKILSTDAGTLAALNKLKQSIDRSFVNQAKANGLMVKQQAQAQSQQPVRGADGKMYIKQNGYWVPVK
jgi:hypothetical protein